MFKRIPDNEVEQFLNATVGASYVAIDTETYYDPRQDGIIRYIKDGRGVLKPNNRPFIMTLSVNDSSGYAIEFNDTTLPYIKAFMESEQCKVMANASFDIHMFMNMGIRPKGQIVDVLIMHNLINEEDIDTNGKRIFGLKAIADKYIGKDSSQFETNILNLRKQIAANKGMSFHDVDYKTVYDMYQKDMVDYACSDTMLTLALYELWLPQIHAEKLEKVYAVEMDIIPIVVDIERNGHPVDMATLIHAEDELSKKLEKLEAQIHELVGTEININSTNDIVESLHEFGFDYNKKSDKGNWLLDARALEALVHHKNVKVAKLAELILEYRRDYKTLNTFMSELKQYYQHTGRVHCNFWQAGTRTGRFSSSNPNLQNISKKDTFVRQCFVPADDYIIAYFDYSQQEYRLLAHYANEVTLIDMIAQGYDVHRATAALLFHKTYEDVTETERDMGKSVNFALVYGLGNAALARHLGYAIDSDTYNAGLRLITGRLGFKPWAIPTRDTALEMLKTIGATNVELLQAEYVYELDVLKAISAAQDMKRKYFAKLPNIKEYIYQCRKECQENGYVRNWLGRKKRYNNPKQEAYKAVNAQIQGGCGDMLKSKLKDLYEFLKPYKSHIINMVHDEVQIHIHKSEIELVPEIQEILNITGFRVLIDCDVEYTTTNWAEKKKFTTLEALKEEVGE